MLHAVIMAGGAGSRFWPESRESLPKQLLNLLGDRSMLQTTLDRLEGLVPVDRVVIATRASLSEAVAAQCPALPASAILAEPCRRDTAPCIGLAALYVARHDSDATMVVLPADHAIETSDAFQRAVLYGAQLVADAPGRIVTFGITPTYPAESFGYVERGETLSARTGESLPTFHCVRFREKPKAEVAREFLAAKTFYWNSGIFVWKARTILDALEKHQPEMFARLRKIAEAFDRPDYQAVLDREFAAIKGVSIDFAVMEHATDVVVVEALFQWDDVGSWQAIARLLGRDEAGNTIAARHIGIETTNSIVHSSDGHLIVTIGMNDCLVVHTPDATLVANKHDEEAVRQVVKLLAERGWTELL